MSSQLATLRVALRRAWFGVGPAATLRALVRHLRRADPEAHRAPATAPSGPHPFDRAYGTDTGGFVGWRDLQSGGAHDPYISGYFGVTPSLARRAIALVEHPEQHTFVDIGCGKGRATILATERPFRRILGVEIAAPLADAARRNATILRDRYPDRPPIEIHHADAAEFDLPPDSLVLFLYQPFERPVMRALLARLAASLERAPRPVTLIYVHPALARLLDATGWLERRAQGSAPPEPDELPFSYGGRAGTETFVLWATRASKPVTGRP